MCKFSMCVDIFFNLENSKQNTIKIALIVELLQSEDYNFKIILFEKNVPVIFLLKVPWKIS